MCSNAVQLQAYQALPARPLGEIRAELQAIDASIGEECSRASMALVDQAANTSRPRIMWTQAIISENDRIIPTAHQLAYWQLYEVPIKLVAGAHYLWDGFNSWEQLCRM